MEFVVLLYLKSTTSADFTEPHSHVSVDKSALRLKWNAHRFSGEHKNAYESATLLL